MKTICVSCGIYDLFGYTRFFFLYIQLFLLFALLAALVYAAPNPAGNDPTVSVLRYKNDQDLEAIQRTIIAQYEKQLGGTTQIHAPRPANVVNPSAFSIHIWMTYYSVKKENTK